MEFQPGSAFPPPSAKQIKEFEKNYDVKLPAEYVAVLKAGNGAVPTTNLFDQGGSERLIERMLCLLEDPEEDDENGWADITVVMTELDARLIDDEDLVGMNVIPIAALFGGDFLCLDYRENPSSPSVAVWDHEESDDFEPHLEEVAPSFREFAGRLRKS